jgi:uracil-DNA glycosylase family 4
VQFLSAERRNPFGMSPPCDRSVPGYGDTAADFHVVGDHPGVHGGTETGVPFTGNPWSERFFRTLERAGLVRDVDLQRREVAHGRTFLSYLHMCVTDRAPTADDYATMEPFFDAELRAITAHVLLPVGARATAHVLDSYTARASGDIDMEALHGSELRGSGWLVVPIMEPAEWSDGDAERLVDGLAELQSTDYRRLSDLGRFFPDDDPYLVR